MSTEFVKDPNDVVQIGQTVKVRVAEIDEQGRVNLSMLFGQDAESKERAPRHDGPDFPRRTTPSEHPLAMQFRRERGTTPSSSDWRSRSSTSRPARPGGFSKDRKPRY